MIKFLKSLLEAMQAARLAKVKQAIKGS